MNILILPCYLSPTVNKLRFLSPFPPPHQITVTEKEDKPQSGLGRGLLFNFSVSLCIVGHSPPTPP